MDLFLQFEVCALKFNSKLFADHMIDTWMMACAVKGNHPQLELRRLDLTISKGPMARSETFIILFWLAIFAESISSPYSLHEEYVGEELLDFFEFEAIPDPTHGRV